MQNVLMRGDQGTAGGGGRVRNRWGQGVRLRAEILAAAGQLLGELGTADGLTLRGVARQAGIAPASVYTQFADRVALIDALVADEQERVAGLMRQAGAAAGPAGHADVIRAQLYAFCRYMLAHPGHYRLMFGRHDDPRTPAARALVEQLVVTLAEGEGEGEGAPLRLPADRAAMVLLVGTLGAVAIGQHRGASAPDRSRSRRPRLRCKVTLVTLEGALCITLDSGPGAEC